MTPAKKTALIVKMLLFFDPVLLIIF